MYAYTYTHNCIVSIGLRTFSTYLRSELKDKFHPNDYKVDYKAAVEVGLIKNIFIYIVMPYNFS